MFILYPLPTDGTDWPTFWVTLFVGVASAAVAGMALFGTAVRKWLMKPQLKLRIFDSEGEVSQFGAQGTEPHNAGLQARWFHVQVSNSYREMPFHEVGVYLTHVSEHDEEWRLRWRGRVLLQWRGEEPGHKGALFNYKTVGPDWEADLFHVRSNDTRLHLNVPVPLAKLSATWPPQAGKDVRIRFAVQARGNEAESAEEVFEVIWNGKWDQADPQNRIQFHKVEQVNAPSGSAV